MTIGGESEKRELAEAQTTSGIRRIQSPPMDPETAFAEIAAVGVQGLRSARSSAGLVIAAGRLTRGCRSTSCPAAGVRSARKRRSFRAACVHTLPLSAQRHVNEQSSV